MLISYNVFLMTIGGFGETGLDSLGFGAKPRVALIKLDKNIAVITTTRIEISFLTLTIVTFDVALGIIGVSGLQAKRTKYADLVGFGLIEGNF